MPPLFSDNNSIYDRLVLWLYSRWLKLTGWDEDDLKRTAGVIELDGNRRICEVVFDLLKLVSAQIWILADFRLQPVPTEILPLAAGSRIQVEACHVHVDQSQAGSVQGQVAAETSSFQYQISLDRLALGQKGIRNGRRVVRLVKGMLEAAFCKL